MTQNAKIFARMINLASAEDRRAIMARTMAEAGVDAPIFDAFDMKADDTGRIARETQAQGRWGVFKHADRAITISHAALWQAFLDSDCTHALVMEDDVFLSPELGAWLQDLSWWPADAQIVKLETWRSRSLKVLLDRAHSHPHLARRVCRLLSRHTGAACYMLTRHAATRLLAERPFSLTVDQLLFNLNASPAARALGIYQVTPALAIQGNLPDPENEVMLHRPRPTGWPLVRQKLLRGVYELAYPLGTIAKALTGRARAEKVVYAAHALPGVSTSKEATG